jgi:hypothetical protein
MLGPIRIARTQNRCTSRPIVQRPPLLPPIIDPATDQSVRDADDHVVEVKQVRQAITNGDVVSTDRHSVRPWFAGHADVSPVVADFEAQGYKLIGGRADYFDHQRATVVAYQHGVHVINVFSWDAGPAALCCRSQSWCRIRARVTIKIKME